MAGSGFVYGVIISAMGDTDDHQRYHRLNAATIDGLPAEDSYPPLIRSMFSMTGGLSASWQTRAIHFGWTNRNFHDRIADWIEKFERLLMALYWWDARVHMELDIEGSLTVAWEIEGSSTRQWRDSGLDLPNRWSRTVTGTSGPELPPFIGRGGEL